MQETSKSQKCASFGDRTLETERLILRPWRESDAPDLYEYAKDETVANRTGFLPHKSVEDSLSILRDAGLMCEYNRAVCLKDGRAIGSIGLHMCDGRVEIGYWLGVPFWGRGLIPEAVKRVVRYAFDECGCTEIYIAYFDGNDNSRRVAEKCGFSYCFTDRDKLWTPTGRTVTEHFTVLSKEDYISKYNK